MLADKVREYMRDEDALKDALLGAQREGHRIIAEANAKADGIIADAKKRADAMMDEVTVKHEALWQRIRQKLTKHIRLWQMPESRLQTSRRLCLICIKEHLQMLSTMPEEDDLEFGFTPQQDEPEEEVPEQEIRWYRSDF